MSVEGCLTEEALTALLSAGLDSKTRAPLQLHLDGCAGCRQLVSEAIRQVRGETRKKPPQGTAGPALIDDRLKKGTLVEGYRIERVLGEGAMGVVYAAKGAEGRVALKMILPSSADASAQELRARLEREARVLKRISHPNVVGIHQVGRHGDEVFLAMELIEGRTFDRWIAETSPPPARIVEVCSAAGEGLAAAHSAGIVHRDLKPQNVMVENGTERAVVMDFGLARRSQTALSAAGPGGVDAATFVTASMFTIGTPAYMAPEQLEGDRATALSDQFSFCVVVYEALFRRRPFPGRTLRAYCASVIEGQFVARPSDAGLDAIYEVLVRGMAKEPSARFRSMDELVVQLRAANS